MTKPHITVVVCTFNRSSELIKALRSLYHLETEGRFNYDIVVIDNASTDATPQTIAFAEEESPVPLRGVMESRKGVVFARNRGIAEATGDWIAFFDDDQLADPRWLVELIRLADEKQVRCVGGAVHLKLPEEHAGRELRTKVRMLLGEARWSSEPMPYSVRIGPGAGNLMLQRSLIEQVGGFDENILGRGEDTDLYFRIRALGETCWFVPTAIIHHLIPPARLQDAFFRRLSVGMGEGVAMHELGQYGTVRFSLIWAAKIARAVLVDGPLYWWARLTGNREEALDRICRIALEQGHWQNGWSLLKKQWSSARPTEASTDTKTVVTT